MERHHPRQPVRHAPGRPGLLAPAAVIAETSPGTPLGQFLTKLLGHSAIRDGQLLAWRT
jgi:hypothetical protein